MLGGLYTDDKCPICGGKMIDNHRDGFVCPTHKDQRANKAFDRYLEIQIDEK